MPARYHRSLKGYARAAWNGVGDIAEDNLMLISAGVAFYSMLSIFPALAALIAVLSLIADPEIVVTQMEDVRELMPNDVYEILNTQIVGLVNTSSDTLGWAGIVSLMVAMWSARTGVGAMMNGLDTVFDNAPRTSLSHYIRALWLTGALIGVGLVAVLMVIIIPVTLKFVPLGSVTAAVIELLRWVIAITVIFIGIGLLYRHGPNRHRARPPFFSPGAVFAVLSWAAMSVAFSFYVREFGNYNEVYGSIGAVIAMQVWLWLSALVVLVGAVLNNQLEVIPKPLATAEAMAPDVSRQALKEAGRAGDLDGSTRPALAEADMTGSAEAPEIESAGPDDRAATDRD
ncbi:YihY/virulence factor BrkB family protein [Sulfitobacter sp. D35]|uniref:YihY/virulence factor BrkB family protein n=1 Tax=Sulfitobacter sp. D35 TaxID=3083252 RepID=UPI00296E56A5|nr:YihY/virulence factor BrkB family protein [Sulfitobacter sp. D35]MDW4499273.1 YihY/virulence factor BrkB family protein [Sulfitobacter sp. D35]